MTAQSTAARPGSGRRFRPAYQQTGVPLEQALHSANAGIIVHRTGLVKNRFRSEGLDFASEIVELINPGDVGHVSVYLYEELFGVHNRLHWMLHMKYPNDYARLLDKVDHSRNWRELADLDRLPTKGGGGWERIFVEGSINERVLCPQHGLEHDGPGHEEELRTFQPAAMYQVAPAPGPLLNSATAALTVHRVAQAWYAVRDEARLFLYEWADVVNQALPGTATAYLFEEIWGHQDRLHLLIHLSEWDAYERLADLIDGDPRIADLVHRPRIPEFKGGGNSGHLFVDGSIAETVLVPRHRDQPRG